MINFMNIHNSALFKNNLGNKFLVKEELKFSFYITNNNIIAYAYEYVCI